VERIAVVEVKVPDEVHCSTYPHGGMVLLNRTTGRWHALNASAGILWRAWQARETFEQGVAAVAGQYPEVSPDRIRADAEQLVNHLVSRGLLQVSLPERGAAAAMAQAPRTYPGPAIGRWQRLLAFGCLLFAVACARLPFRATYRLVRFLHRRHAEPPAAPRARSIVAAVHLVARWYPGRAACFELSLAAVALAALYGLRLDWCLGAAADPYRFHAWVEAAGRPVPEPGEPAEQAPFARVLTI
jgi:Transglutaminase-like superfamily/Coenzyme PQQ synthesis protein D (PqqD)